MTLRGYYLLLCRGKVWFFVALAIVAGVLAGLVLHPPRSDQRSLSLFIVVAVLVPLLVGHVLASAVHAVQHRPFSMILPRAGRRFAIGHAVIVAFAAILCAWAGHRVIPAPVLFCISAATLSLAVPLEPDGRWYGSRLLFAAIAGVLVLIGVFAREVRQGILAEPWIVSLLGLGIAIACFLLGFSREPLRRRAGMRSSTILEQAVVAADELAGTQREALMRSTRIGRRWKHGPVVGNSVWPWLRVAIHERFGFTRCGWGGFVLMFFVAWAVIAVWKDMPGREGDWAEHVYFHLSQPTREYSPISLLTLFLLGSILTPFLRSEWLYPLSRRQRTWVAYIGSAMQAAVLFVTFVVLALLAAGISARIVGRPFELAGALHLTGMLLAGLWVMPAFQWVVFYLTVRRDPAVQTLWIFSAMVGGALLTDVIRSAWDAIFSPAGIVICAVAVVASQWGYYLALRRYFRDGDLLQRGAKRQNPGLV